MPLGPFGNAFSRSPSTGSRNRSQFHQTPFSSAFSRQSGVPDDPDNVLGSRIGRIGDRAPVALGQAPASVLNRQALADYHKNHLGSGRPYGMMPGAVGARPDKTYTTSYDSKYDGVDGSVPFTSTGRPASVKIKSRPWTMPSLSSNDEGEPSLLNGKPVTPEMQLRIAQNRARQGMSLDDTSRALLASHAPAGGNAIAGAFAPRQDGQLPVGAAAGPQGQNAIVAAFGQKRPYRGPDARSIITDRAQQKTADRQLRMAVRSGMSPQMAMLNRAGPDSPLMQAFAYGGPAAARLAGDRIAAQSAMDVARMTLAAKPQQISPDDAMMADFLRSGVEAGTLSPQQAIAEWGKRGAGQGAAGAPGSRLGAFAKSFAPPAQRDESGEVNQERIKRAIESGVSMDDLIAAGYTREDIENFAAQDEPSWWDRMMSRGQGIGPGSIPYALGWGKPADTRMKQHERRKAQLGKLLGGQPQ